MVCENFILASYLGFWHLPQSHVPQFLPAMLLAWEFCLWFLEQWGASNCLESAFQKRAYEWKVEFLGNFCWSCWAAMSTTECFGYRTCQQSLLISLFPLSTQKLLITKFLTRVVYGYAKNLQHIIPSVLRVQRFDTSNFETWSVAWRIKWTSLQANGFETRSVYRH